jgi:Co/Zn/Cd efflux system component
MDHLDTIVSTLTSLLTLLSAAGALYNSIRNRQQGKRNEAKIQDVHLSLDGRLQEFLELTRASSRAEGVLEGKMDAGTSAG